jgi:hypothetical protein
MGCQHIGHPAVGKLGQSKCEVNLGSRFLVAGGTYKWASLASAATPNDRKLTPAKKVKGLTGT